MFGTIRKHSNWLWTIIIVFVGVGMVVFFSPDVSLGPRVSEGDFGTISGRPITQGEYLDARQEVYLAYFFQSGGKWPDRSAEFENRLEGETISRAFLIHKLKEMDIKVSEKAAALMEHGQLRDMPYAEFEKNHLQQNGITILDYKRFVRHQAAIQQLFNAVAATGRLVTPADVESLWRKENQQISAQLAVFWTSNYVDRVTITNGAVANFYTNRQAFYRLRDRLTLGYVEFTPSNYFAEADSKLAGLTNLNEIVSEYYSRGRMNTNLWTDTNGVPLPEAAAKEKIREEIRMNQALSAAHRAAAAFGTQLMNQQNANAFTSFEALARTNNLGVKITKPFDNQGSGLEEFEDTPLSAPSEEDSLPESLRDIIRQKAFALTADRPVLFTPIVSKSAVYVIARHSMVPSEQQPLASIQDKVTADYKSFMAAQLARTAGQAFHTNLTNGLAQKKSFTDICAAERVKTIDLPPFSASSRNLTNVDSRINVRLLQSLAQETEVGKASAFLPAQPSSEGGFILYARARPPVDEAKLKTELPEYVNRIRSLRQDEAVQQWFRKQIDQAKVAGPKRETTTGAPN